MNDSTRALEHIYNIKCINCDNIFCKEHFELHISYYKNSSRQIQVGALITELDKDFHSECIVCIAMRDIHGKQ